MMYLVLAVAVLLLLFAGWLRAAGTAISRVPRGDAMRDASDDVPGAESVAEMLDDREVISPAVGVVGSGLLIFSAVLGIAAFSVEATAATALWRALVVGFVAFVVGDLVPRRLGRVAPHLIAYRSAGLLRVSVLLGGWANELLPEGENGDEGPLDEENDETADEQERELIDSVLEFSETLVREAMTPRPDMVTIPVSATLDDVIALSSDAGYSRIPVVGGSEIVGLVIVKDLLSMFSEEDRPETVAELMRPVDFVPETKLAAQLLTEMRASHVHQMVVVDEYGDIAGLITIEDLLEELVGEIADETDDEEIMFAEVGRGLWAVDARMAVEDLAEELEVELPSEEWDTVGGLVLGFAERVPEEGEEFQIGDLRFTVVRMQGRRVSELAVARDVQVGTA